MTEAGAAKIRSGVRLGLFRESSRKPQREARLFRQRFAIGELVVYEPMGVKFPQSVGLPVPTTARVEQKRDATHSTNCKQRNHEIHRVLGNERHATAVGHTQLRKRC